MSDSTSSIRRSTAPAPDGVGAARSTALPMWSLHATLRVIGLTVAAVAGLIGFLGVYAEGRERRSEMLDEQLQVLAHTVLTFSQHELVEVREAGLTQDPVHLDSTAAMSTGYRYQIWDKSGMLRLYSTNAPARAPLLPLSYRGYHRVDLKGERLRAYATEGQLDGMVVQVAIPEAFAHIAVGPATWRLLAWTLIAFALLFVASGWFLSRALKPVDVMADQLRKRSPADLARLDIGPPPPELQPIVHAINALFARIDQTISAERGFIGMAAHELRTPLAGLRLQAQLLASSNTAAERRTLAESLAASVDRTSHSVDQLLDHTRMHESESLPPELTRVDLQATFESVMSDLQHHPAMQDKTVRCELQHVHLHADSFGLYTLMRNLLANAAMYSPAEATVRISAEQDAHAVGLVVDDSGPGIPPHERERVFDRFYRGGASPHGGTGLGLTIVRSIVRRHGAHIELQDSPLGGLRVRVRFPRRGDATES